MKSNYPDGFYTITNPRGVPTDVEVKRGLVYIVDGFAGGATGQTLEEIESRGCTVSPLLQAIEPEYKPERRIK